MHDLPVPADSCDEEVQRGRPVPGYLLRGGKCGCGYAPLPVSFRLLYLVSAQGRTPISFFLFIFGNSISTGRAPRPITGCSEAAGTTLLAETDGRPVYELAEILNNEPVALAIAHGSEHDRLAGQSGPSFKENRGPKPGAGPRPLGFLPWPASPVPSCLPQRLSSKDSCDPGTAMWPSR